MAVFAFLRAHSALKFAFMTFLVSSLAAENFNATYGSSPAPFKIDVHPAFIEETLLKVSLTRYVVDVDEPDLASGPPRHNVTTVRDYWLDHYNWFDVQNRLNKRCLFLCLSF